MKSETPTSTVTYKATPSSPTNEMPTKYIVDEYTIPDTIDHLTDDDYYCDKEELEMEEYAQHVEIKTKDVMNVIIALTNAGYECRVWNDGESTDYMAIDFVHPEFTGHRFVESEW